MITCLKQWLCRQLGLHEPSYYGVLRRYPFSEIVTRCSRCGQLEFSRPIRVDDAH